MKPTSLNLLGFLRVAVVVPEVFVADVEANTTAVLAALKHAAAQGCQLALFPELSLSSYSCADLFYQEILLSAVQRGLQKIAEATVQWKISAVVGAPFVVEGKAYNCGVFLSEGTLKGIVPKSFLPTTGEYYEQRWFTPAYAATSKSIRFNGQEIPFGTDLLFRAQSFPQCVVGIEICEDLWTVQPPSADMALAGATVLLNLSASNEVLGKAEYRRELVQQQSARCLAAYLYSSAGPGESSTDVIYSGHALIAENGILLGESARFQFTTQSVVVDLDLTKLTHERLVNSSFSASTPLKSYRVLEFNLSESVTFTLPDIILQRPVTRLPFVPADDSRRSHHCREIFSIQATGLAKRLKHTQLSKIVLGVSGGLDSTLALLVTVKAFEMLGLPRQGIVTVHMPGFGTSPRTQENAEKLATLLAVHLRQISIIPAVLQHFRDLGHHPELQNTTYENAQARERTQILMDLANQVHGLVVGTGDLSELALGWCTYNGDQMAMYNVNAGIPKTLVRYLVQWVAETQYSANIANILADICATPITPELLPLGQDQTIQQKTEAVIGAYELNDFFLYYVVRQAATPLKILALAATVFGKEYSLAELLKGLEMFYQRFFANQFKRSAMPDGPKVGSVALSPRGDWRMPSDASCQTWLRELEYLRAEL